MHDTIYVIVYAENENGDIGHLQDVLNKWNEPKYEHLQVWVVPVDVHR